MILKIEISTCDISRVNCVMDRYNTKCTVSNLTVTSKNYTLVAQPSSITVTKFELVKSVVSVLTSNICNTFTKLNSFTAIDQHIESVEDNAFDNCTEITYINLEKNNIHELGKGTFSKTKKLQELYILGGLLEYIDADLFSNLGELKVLLFGANGLKELPVTAVKNLRKLENLYLYSNDLSDLDAKGLVENLVNLKAIYINDNNFHCKRLDDIIEVFEAKKILCPDDTFHTHIKKRDYIPRKGIRHIICLTEAQLRIETLKKGLGLGLDKLKDFPIGKEIIQLQTIVKNGFINSDSAVKNLADKQIETVDNLTAKMTNLNETLKNALTKINDSVSKLKQEMLAKQQILVERVSNTTLRLQKLDESYTILMNATSSSGRSNKSLSGKMFLYWVCLAILLLVIVVMGFCVIKKSRKVVEDVPLLCYEERVGGRQAENFNRKMF